MAISYDLECATESSATEVAARLAEIGKGIGVFDATVTPDLLLDPGVNTRHGTSIRVTQERTPHPWHPVVADLHFTPTVSAAFRMAKGVEVGVQQDDMLRLVLPLLEQIDGEAVLHFQYESIWLLRKNGELILSENDDLWRPHRISFVLQPYKRETHRFED
ncbi:SitI3 family protein [Streptomyces sp. NPDC047042]|uniref:SitI3 family protein n=1 Tax=Streptomyces sp. NPDC047042 TaxID=3154807 RepID=UPI00340FB221